MRRWVLALAVFCLMASAFAGEYVKGGIGGSVYTDVPQWDMGRMEGYTFGLDGSVRIMWFGLSLSGMYKQVDSQYRELSVLMSIGPDAVVAGKVRLGLEAGPRFRVLLDKNGDKFLYDLDGSIQTAGQTIDYFSRSPVSYRVFGQWLLDKASVGLSYQVDTGYRFKTWAKVKDLLQVDWMTGKLGLTVLYWF